jgi:hypothetical protein
MLLKTKYWQYFLRLCTRTGLEISTMQDIISSLEPGCATRVGDYSFRLMSKENEKFGTVYRVEVYERHELVLKSPVLLHRPLKESREPSAEGKSRS